MSPTLQPSHPMNEQIKKNIIKVYADNELTTNFMGRIFVFKKADYFGQAVYVCDAPDDQLTHELCKIPPFTVIAPVPYHPQSEEKQRYNKLLLIGSFEENCSVLGTPYYFKKDTQGIYVFNLALIPEHHATIMIDASPETFWLVDNIPAWRQAIKSKIEVDKHDEQQKKLKAQEFTHNQLHEIEKRERENKSGDKRTLQEVLFNVFTKDASQHGIELVPDQKKAEEEHARSQERLAKKREELDKKKQDDFLDRILKENQDDIDKSKETFDAQKSVRVSPVIESIHKLVTPDDLPSLQRDIDKTSAGKKPKKEIPPDTIKTNEYTYHKFKELLRDNKFEIDELEYMILHEKRTDKRTSITALIRKKINEIKKGKKS